MYSLWIIIVLKPIRIRLSILIRIRLSIFDPDPILHFDLDPTFHFALDPTFYFDLDADPTLSFTHVGKSKDKNLIFINFIYTCASLYGLIFLVSVRGVIIFNILDGQSFEIFWEKAVL
jgi:hypothetical protein